jgi:nucleotide-binding universal stress UspA family protein
LFSKILVAYDESPEADKALRAGIQLAKALGAELCVVSVIEPYPASYSFAPSALAMSPSQWREEKMNKYALLHEKAREQAKKAGLWLDTELVDGDEVDSIVEHAERYRAELLILGMRKHTLLLRGHTANEVAEHSPCAVMGIR